MTQSKLIFIASTLLIAIAVTYFALNFSKVVTAQALQAVPVNATYIIEIDQIKQFEQSIINTPIWDGLQEIQPALKLYSGLVMLNIVCASDQKLSIDHSNETIVAAAFLTKAAELDYVFILQLNKSSKINLDKLIPVFNNQQPKITQHQSDNEAIYELEYTNAEQNFSFAKAGGLFIISHSTVLVENAVYQLKNGAPITSDQNFSTVYDLTEKNNAPTIYLNCKQLANYLSMFANNDYYKQVMKIQNFAAWIGLDIEFNDDAIAFNGYAAALGDTTNYVINAGKGDEGKRTDFTRLMPTNTALAFQVNGNQLAESLFSKIEDPAIKKQFMDSWSPWLSNKWVFGISESFDLSFNNKSFIILECNDSKKAQQHLSRIAIKESLNYRNYALSKLVDDGVLQIIAGLSQKQFQSCYFAAIDKTIVFSPSINQLKNMIDAFENKQTLSEDEEYTSIMKQLPSSFNNFIYINLAKSEFLMRNMLANKKMDSVQQHLHLLQKFNPLALQFTSNNQNFIVSGILPFNKEVKKKSGLIWQTQIDAPICRGPFLIQNSTNNQKNSILQDTSKQLYLLSADGDVIWKKQMPDLLIGGIWEVDFYSNNKHQFVCNTKQGIYLIDLNGDDVEGFPISLTSAATNPVSVFINNQTNNYIMFIACENGNLYGYFKDGKPLAGWNPLSGLGIIKHPIVKISDKKTPLFLIANAIGNLVIKNENGKTVGQIQQIEAGGLEFYALQNSKSSSFIAFSPEGSIFKLTAASKLTIEHIGANLQGVIGDFNLDGNAEYCYLSGNLLTVKEQDGSLLYTTEIEQSEQYTLIACQLPNGGDAIGLFSVQSQRTLLLDESGKVYDGFPIEGACPFVIGDMTNNGDKILITGKQNVVMGYRIK